MNSEADKKVQKLRHEIEALRAKVKGLESKNLSPPEAANYFETPQGRIIFIAGAAFISLVILRILGL